MINAASTQVITVADRSMKAVSKAVADLVKVSTDLNTLVGVSENLSDDIQQKESQLAALGQQFEVELRTKKAELAVQVLEDETTTLQLLMAKRDLATVTTGELTKLAAELNEAQADRQADIKEAVTQVTKELNAASGAKLAAVENAHKVETATLKAESTSKDERITFLTVEIAALRNQIEAERSTRLEIARADAGRQGVVVNAGKQ